MKHLPVLLVLLIPSVAAAQQRGFTAGTVVARAYDLILNADFDGLAKALPSTCPPAPPVACLGLEALSLWWQIQLDPESKALDAAFLAKVNAAIAEAERMTQANPDRSEAWFYLGAAYGVRAQFRVHRVERLAAARDGKRIKASLERALAIDPAMHDAEFGIGMYRYYADVAPAFFRFLRVLLLLPGGDREDGLRQLERAAAHGVLVRGEAQYQIHILSPGPCELIGRVGEHDANGQTVAIMRRTIAQICGRRIPRQLIAGQHDGRAANARLLTFSAYVNKTCVGQP